MNNTRIRNEKELVAAIAEYLAQGLSLAAITEAVNARGVCAYAVGIQLLMQKHNLKLADCRTEAERRLTAFEAVRRIVQETEAS